MALKNLIGVKFSMLTVVSLADKSASGKIRWACKCDCGNESFVQTSNLTNGHTKSCGCQKFSGFEKTKGTASLKHGMSNTRTYRSWMAMITRCRDRNVKEYKYYGARGISVCERWLDFANFYSDMGNRPLGKSLDRINVNGNYEPTNCRWATAKEQGRNKRNNRIVKGFVLAELSEITGINKSTIKSRLRNGKDALLGKTVEALQLKAAA